MVLTINLMYAVGLTTITGALVMLLWLPAGFYLKRTGEMHQAFLLMKAELFFWMVPVVYLILLAFQKSGITGYGYLFEITPTVLTISRIFFLVWIIGSTVGLSYHIFERIRLHIWRKCAMPCGVQECRAFSAICKEYGISRENIDLMYLPDLTGPQVIGMFHPCVLIPDADYTDCELKVIFRHELMHVKRHDLIFKQVIELVCVVHFFNPAFKLYHRMMEDWLEIACDEDVCRNISSRCESGKAGEGRLSVYEYFKTLLYMSVNENHTSVMLPLFGNKSQLRKRMEYVCMEHKCSKLYLTILAAAVIVLGSTGVVYAGVVTTADLSEPLYKSTVVLIEETADYESGAGDDLIEYETEGLADGISETEGEVTGSSKSSSSVYSFTWTVNASSSVKSSAFSAKSGQGISVSVVLSDSADGYINVGIIDPTGVRRYVKVSSDSTLLSHTFTLTKTGFYRIYVENTSSSSSVGVAGFYQVVD